MNDSIVSIKVQGGMGNLMFQMGFALAYSIIKDCQYEILDYDINIQFNKHAKNRFNSENYQKNIFSRFDFTPKTNFNVVAHNEIPFHYSEVPFIPNNKNIYLGYFQSEKYFYNLSDEIKKYFYPSENFINESKNINFDFSNSVALHVRRGDFVHLAANHPPVSLEYINQSINYFGKNKNYLIVSDDINWCKENIKVPNCYFSENRPDYLDFYSMLLCDHNIISNSTFSWWAAFLNKNDDKTVIRPSNWFGTNYSHLSDEDLIPKNWIKF